MKKMFALILFLIGVLNTSVIYAQNQKASDELLFDRYLASAGLSSATAFGFTSATNTGMYLSGGNLKFSIGGVDKATISSTGLSAGDIGSGTLPIARGGTNSATTLNNNRLMQSSGSAITEAAAITASRALISDANGIPTHSTVTSTQLGYVDATSSIQTQLNGKSAPGHTHAVADVSTLAGGTYSPTIALIAGTCSSYSVLRAMYQKIGNAVSVNITFSYVCSINPTFTFTVPVTGNLSNAYDLHGTSIGLLPGGGQSTQVKYDSGNPQKAWHTPFSGSGTYNASLYFYYQAS